MSINLTVNGEPRALPDGTTVADLIARTTAHARGVAVAIDGEVVTRADWAATPLRDGQHVEILTAVQGG